MTTTALVSIIGPDRVGLVSAITGRLFDLGADLGDTSFAVLGGGAEFTAICEFSGGMELEVLQAELEALPELVDAEVKVSRFELSSMHPASETITHTITVSGGDSPGLMARLCEVFQQFDANIVRLNSERVPGVGQRQYVISASVAIPPQNENTCLATVTNTAGELGLTCQWTNVSA
ncbi:glycine cleavage system protein R [Magnetovibrio sp.]|uniref:glycine cleavage system protein R n=1 Tax=Magnetovibrio sp. TaxID=2024836 RepID=UPI002F9263F0